MTTEERADLHEQATQLAYTAILLADLSPHLSCDEWDGLADRMGKQIVESILERIDDEQARIEAVKEAARRE